MIFIKLENCLCKCYMQTESDDIKLFANCSCECYTSKQKAMMMYLSSWRIVVYVNVTSNQKVMMIFIKKLENCLCECYIKNQKAMMIDNIIKLENCCLCECYTSKQKAMMMYLSRSWRIVYVNVTSNQKAMMMYLSSRRIVVYVNVTSNQKVMMIIFIKLGNCCLCKCCIKSKSDDDVFIKLENGLCKCYIKSKSDDDDIYQVGELFM
jgi:hypothetical protein